MDNAQRQQRMDDATAETRGIKAAYEKVFKSPNGKIVMRHMKATWMDTKIIGTTPEQTTANAAIHDVIQTIINYAEKQDA